MLIAVIKACCGAARQGTGADSYLSVSDSFGNYRTSRARVEIKIISTSTGDVIWTDSTYAGTADTAEVISGKKAIQKAVAKLAIKAAAVLLK